MAQESLDLYIDNLLKEAKLDNLPQEYKDQYVGRLKEQINRRLGIIIMENLDDEGLEEFSRLMAQEPQPDITAIQTAFVEKITDFDRKIKTALLEFGRDFIAGAQK